MSEQDLFEARLHAALQRYASQVTSDLDPVAFARVVATKTPRRAFGWLAWPRGAAPLGRIGWLVLVALLLAIIAGIVGAGAIRRLPAPYGLARPGLIAFGTSHNHMILTDAEGSHPRDISTGAAATISRAGRQMGRSSPSGAPQANASRSR